MGASVHTILRCATCVVQSYEDVDGHSFSDAAIMTHGNRRLLRSYVTFSPHYYGRFFFPGQEFRNARASFLSVCFFF